MQNEASSGRGGTPVGAGYSMKLLANGWISRHDLSIARRHADREHAELADSVVVLGLVAESDSYAALALAAGLEIVDLDGTASSELAIRLVPERLARRHLVVPLSVDNRTLTYATCRPFNAEAERDVAVRVRPPDPDARGHAIRSARRARSLLSEAARARRPRRAAAVRAARTSSRREVTASGHAGSTVIDLCDHLIGRAVEVGASDVHIECGSEGTLVRYRICGVLEPVLTLPASVSQPIRNRFKIMAQADIAVRHRPQDGAFRLKVNGRPIDVRLSTLPTVDGEKLVMRVIDSHSPLHLARPASATTRDTLMRLERALARPDGLVLVTGPTGSGKTTALYAALGHLRTGRTNIVSVEDPVERTHSRRHADSGERARRQHLPGAAAVAAAAGSERHHGRRDPRRRSGADRRAGGLHRPPGAVLDAHRRRRDGDHPADQPRARAVQGRREPVGGARAAAAALALPALPARAHRVRSAAAGQPSTSCTSVPASAGAGLRALQAHRLLGPAAGRRAADPLRRAARRDRPRRHRPRDPRRDARRRRARRCASRRCAWSPTASPRSKKSTACSSAERPSTSRQHGRQRVLVTDDEPITRMLVKLLLEKANFEVLEAANGRDAVEIATREHPDLVLIDLNMPEMDGYEAIARMRQGHVAGDAADPGADVGRRSGCRAARAGARRRRLHHEAVRPGRAAVAGQRGLPAAESRGGGMSRVGWRF